MNALDELLASTGRVEDITPDGLRNGRAALESTFHDARTQQAPAPERPSAAALREPARKGHRRVHRRGSGRRGRDRGCRVARPASCSQAPASGKNRRGHRGLRLPRGRQGRQGARRAAGRLAARRLLASRLDRDRAGRTYHRDIWIAHNGDAVLEDGGLPGPPGPQPVRPPGSGFGYLGTKPGWLTWGEIYALPTDPAKLAPVLTRDSVGLGGSLAQNLWSVVVGLLVETPASPALREALYDVAANIPGVGVNSDYTDSLGADGYRTKPRPVDAGDRPGQRSAAGLD